MSYERESDTITLPAQQSPKRNPSTGPGARDTARIHPASDHRIEVVTGDLEQKMTFSAAV
jgi:hypothetical protein